MVDLSCFIHTMRHPLLPPLFKRLLLIFKHCLVEAFIAAAFPKISHHETHVYAKRRPHWRVFYRKRHVSVHHLKPASLKRWICSSDSFVLGFWFFCIFLYDPLRSLHHCPREASSPCWETSQWPYLALKAMRSLKCLSNDCFGPLLFLLFPDVCWIASKCTGDVESFSIFSSLDTISSWNCWSSISNKDDSFSLSSSSLDNTNKTTSIDFIDSFLQQSINIIITFFMIVCRE